MVGNGSKLSVLIDIDTSMSLINENLCLKMTPVQENRLKWVAATWVRQYFLLVLKLPRNSMGEHILLGLSVLWRWHR